MKMKQSARLWALMPVVWCALGLAFPRRAEAVEQVFPPPEAQASLAIYVGTVDGIPRVIYQEQNGGRCFLSAALGPAGGGLIQNYIITGANDENDGPVTIYVDQQVTVCGMSLAPLAYNGHELLLIGSTQNDVIVNWGPGPVSANAWKGNDLLVSFSVVPYNLVGGEGDDIIESLVDNPLDSFSGEGGNDCLFDQDFTHENFDCGDDEDRMAGFQPNAVSCENPVPSCT
jgi:hypothetical protein